MASGLQASAQLVWELLLGLVHKRDNEPAAAEDEVFELSVRHPGLQGVGVLAVEAYHAAVGDGEVGLGPDAAGVPVLDQGAQLGQVLGVGDAVPDPTHLDRPGVLEDGMDSDVSPRDADVALIVDEVAQAQALDALVDTVDVHGPGDRSDGSRAGVGAGHASQPSGAVKFREHLKRVNLPCWWRSVCFRSSFV